MRFPAYDVLIVHEVPAPRDRHAWLRRLWTRWGRPMSAVRDPAGRVVGVVDTEGIEG